MQFTANELRLHTLIHVQMAVTHRSMFRTGSENKQKQREKVKDQSSVQGSSNDRVKDSRRVSHLPSNISLDNFTGSGACVCVCVRVEQSETLAVC